MAQFDPITQQLAGANSVFEDFEPDFDWAHDQGSDTLLLALPGFRREQLKVQITSARVLKVLGERHMGENRWRRFYKEFPLTPNSDPNAIAAKFERGTLYIKVPKLLPSKPQPLEEPPKPQQPPTQKDAQEAKTNGVSQKMPSQKMEPEEITEARTSETQGKTNNGVSQKIPQKEKGKSEELAERSTAAAEARAFETQKKTEESDLSSRQTQTEEAINGGLFGELKKQKKAANLLVAIFLVLLLGLYIKNSIKSSFGGSKTQEL